MHADKVDKRVHNRFSLKVIAESEKKPKVKKVGLSLDSALLSRLDEYAERNFKGNRSTAANYLLSALLKKSP